MGRIVAIGECMGELSETGAPGTLTMGYAGDTLNTAWYLRRRLGADWQVDYLTAVGSDVLSQRLVDFLEGEGIGTQHVRRARRQDDRSLPYQPQGRGTQLHLLAQ